ncbi:oxygen-independent coproporphyrinogen III oxidase [Kordiimonas aestuarii]|uniref:oxygen-independent coproporphyrinogen III oxidase n=1 Tax=Kordiimonas aestuarii TaxID=1005925 RepID=UPI0021D1D5FE|nr:oxygen-independent coproporphyrinogen III oxidase [Kordiimonas aestuarii]
MSALQDALLKRNGKVPRYTSYPTAPHFSAAVTGDSYTSWLNELRDDASLSLYLHIPYCRQICWYCGCFTKATRKYEPVTTYVDTLLDEIALIRARLSGRQTVGHIHFGGGSPSMLSPRDFTRIMAAIRQHYVVDRDAEVAIELDPREVTEAKVAAYARMGVNRVSLGVQDFHEHVQRAIGRRQPFHVIYDAVQLLKSYGIDEITMDLLYGLPHQTTTDVEENVDLAAALGPGRIALFGYAHVPWMKKHMRLINEDALPDGAARLKLFDAGAGRLASRGYRSIGLDHFVRPTDEMALALSDRTLRRNFQGYTTDTTDALIGFGISAISALPQGYAQNTLVASDYERALAAGQPPVVKGRATTRDIHCVAGCLYRHRQGKVRSDSRSRHPKSMGQGLRRLSRCRH